MAQERNNKDSIYFQLLRLLVIAAAVAGLVYLALDYAAIYLIDSYYYDSGYEKQKNEKYIEQLQKYIDKNELSSKDVDALNTWVTKQKLIMVSIFKDGFLVFDSEYPDEEVWEEEIAVSSYVRDSDYTVVFSDGEAQVRIVGLYDYQVYNISLIAELIFAFGLFLTLVLLGIRRKMKYILKLRDEIEILEGGSLDCRISVEGKDELTALAKGLDSMRCSFQDMVEKEAKVVWENQKIITEMSHDIRTPVTSILLYTEILRKGKYEGEGQLREYIVKIDRKARRLKQLTDHLFEYSLVTGNAQITLEEPESFEVLFYDLFSETSSYLEQNGFDVDFRVEWFSCEVQIFTDYITRIMDNITSNIIKYADPGSPVRVRSIAAAKKVGFSFENVIRRTEEKVESTQVGIQSIQGMMAKMGGTCVAGTHEELFYIEIMFPVKE